MLLLALDRVCSNGQGMEMFVMVMGGAGYCQILEIPQFANRRIA